MPLEIVWSVAARNRLREIHDYVARDKPDAAARLSARVVSTVEVLRNYPSLGRAGVEPGVRELVIGGTPYVVLYKVRSARITISTVWHAAQSRKSTTKKPK